MMIDEKNGLKVSHQQKIIAIFHSNKRIEKACLFGSRAMGTFKSNSDIDLVIEGKNLTLDDLSVLIDKLDRTTIPYKIDLLIKHQTSNRKQAIT